MPLRTRLSIALFCGFLAISNGDAMTSLWCNCDAASESSESGDAPESDSETDSIGLALLGYRDPLVQVAAQTVGSPDSRVAVRGPSFDNMSLALPSWLSVGTGTGGPLRC